MAKHPQISQRLINAFVSKYEDDNIDSLGRDEQFQTDLQIMRFAEWLAEHHHDVVPDNHNLQPAVLWSLVLMKMIDISNAVNAARVSAAARMREEGFDQNPDSLQRTIDILLSETEKQLPRSVWRAIQTYDYLPGGRRNIGCVWSATERRSAAPVTTARLVGGLAAA